MLPTVTVDQMREVDRVMVDELHVELMQMMENAGSCLARHTRSWLGGNAAGQRVVVLAGSGGNGGGGLVAARRLAIWGADVSVILGQPRERMHGVPAHQLGIVERLDVPVSLPDQLPPGVVAHADAIVDALIGYSLQGPLREPVASLVRAANAAAAPVIALDVPSGLNADTGRPIGVAVRAATTLSLALPKAGLVRPEAREWVGALHLADISVPAGVYRRLGLEVGPIFGRSDIVALDLDDLGAGTTPASMG